MAFDPEFLKQQVPYYLTAEDQQILLKNLKSISSGERVDYFLSGYDDGFRDQMLQGDGWSGFEVFLFKSGKRRFVRGIVLSNTCDVSPENSRDLPTRVVFAPLVKLSAFQKLLISNDISAKSVASKIASIKAQKTTNIFYLPAGGPLPEDYIIRFDETQSMLMSGYRESDEFEKLFTLSNTGFYMLTLKLSIHFCRLQENIQRKEQPTTA